MTASTISSYSGDGELIKQVIRRGLIILSFAIVLLAGTSLWTSAQLTNFYHDEVNIVSEQEHLLQTMRLTSRERTLLLYDMATESDPFVRDEHRMDFYSKGAKFAQARIEFSQLPLKPTESLVLEEQGKATGITVP
ncbi:MAG: hypothetical protein OEW97_00635, partial [Gammaproteobacteria bacterium]|nr:hypothetical protein [Gammaproteobacteria bacterium]